MAKQVLNIINEEEILRGVNFAEKVAINAKNLLKRHYNQSENVNQAIDALTEYYRSPDKKDEDYE